MSSSGCSSGSSPGVLASVVQVLQHAPGRMTGSRHVTLGHSVLMLRHRTRATTRFFLCTFSQTHFTQSQTPKGEPRLGLHSSQREYLFFPNRHSEDFQWRRFHSCLGLMRSWLSLPSGISSAASLLLPLLPRDLARGVPSTTNSSVDSSTASTNTRHQHTPTTPPPPPQALHHIIVGGSAGKIESWGRRGSDFEK